MTRITVVADDLSGAVETAATFLLRTTRIAVTLDLQAVTPFRPAPAELGAAGTIAVQVIDTDSRHLSAAAAGDRAALAFRAADPDSLAFKKIDSLLRGHLVPELLAARAVRPQLVVAPALPAAGRTVRDGVVYVDDRPLHETPFWHAEPVEPPTDIAAALAPIPTTVIALDQIRGGSLAGVLATALAAGAVPVCDAETDADLDLVAAAAITVEDVVLVGSAGLAGALARTVALEPDDASRDPNPADATVLVIVGSAAHGITDQLRLLEAAGAVLVLAAADELLAPTGVAQLRSRLETADGDVIVVGIDPASPVSRQHSRELVRRLADSAAVAAAEAGSLLLTGGETARVVLDQLHIGSLRPLLQVHHGAVVSAGPSGQLIATRPGSFGGRESLLSIVRALQQVHTPTEESV